MSVTITITVDTGTAAEVTTQGLSAGMGPAADAPTMSPDVTSTAGETTGAQEPEPVGGLDVGAAAASGDVTPPRDLEELTAAAGESRTNEPMPLDELGSESAPTTKTGGKK